MKEEKALAVIENGEKGLDLDPIRNLDFAVIGKEEMNEISEFINTKHAHMLNNFSKSQSNFMDTMLVFNAGTDIRNLRQISAEIEKKKMALSETQFKLRKKNVELKKLALKFEGLIDPLDIELCEIEIQELIHGREQSRSYIEAALKTILNMKQQFEAILANKGITDVTELDFEKEEEEYHLKKSLHQAFEDIVACGRISVGNNKYLLQMGVMPNLVHDSWIKFLATPDSYDKGKFLDVLEEMYENLKGCSITEAKRRGITKLFHKNSVLQIEK